jgi:hypothetical protein
MEPVSRKWRGTKNLKGNGERRGVILDVYWKISWETYGYLRRRIWEYSSKVFPGEVC